MDITNLQRPGQKLATGDARALFLIEFGGMVLNAFREKTVFLGKHVLRIIQHGQGERFDALGKAAAQYHVPGTDLSANGQVIKHDTFNILIDGKLIAHLYVDEVEEAMNHFPIMQEYADKLATALAKQYDFTIASCGILAARAGARIPDGFGGSVISAANMGTDMTVLTKAIFDAQVVFDNKDVPDQGRWLFLRPEHYSMLVQNFDIINTLYGGRGTVAEGNIIKLAGFDIIKANQLPNTNVTGTYENKYDGDFTNTIGLAMTREAVGTVQLMGLSTEYDRDFNRQAKFLAAHFVLGHSWLRPECAIELATTAPTP